LKVVGGPTIEEQINWHRPVWGDDWAVMKRSGRDEAIRVVIHMCMEAMLGIRLYSYLYLKLAKTLHLSYYRLCFLFNKIGQEGRTGSAWKQGGSWWENREGTGGRDGPNNVNT
jgi:hypothetical protein